MTPDNLLTLAGVILLLPLLGFVILIFFGKKLGRASGWLGTGILAADLALSAVVAFNKLVYYGDAGMIQVKFNWFDLISRKITIGIGLDNLSVIMLIVVTLISTLVHLFSTEYMADDKRYSRFYAYLGIFTFSMLGIVIANNLLNMYIFWELVGISSYLLIGFWYEKDSAANASKKAFLTNRIGDLGFFIGIMICFFTYDTFMFDEIFAKISSGIIPFDSGFWLTMAGILLFCGAIGKSAQFPLHVWLPDAMEGPTPVSALIHAATMVAAGVYLTARIFPMLTADAMLFVAYIGAITAFVAATIAITQNDFKKILAYSTVSQLGYMIMALGVGAYTNGFMHLVTHAWFKACLFLASGSVIHAMHHAMHHAHNHDMDPQDIRNMGGLRHTMPKTYYTFLFATLAIAGVPFTSGFLSKDGILAGTLAFGKLTGHWTIPIAGFAAAGMTAFYMFRLAIEAFHGKPKTHIAEHTHENKAVITGPLILLAALSIFAFYSWNPLDATNGWFQKLTAAPATAVPAAYQYDFIMPLAKHEAAPAAHEAAPAHEATAPAEEHGSAHHALNIFEETMHGQHTTAMILSLLIAGGGILLSFTFYQFKIFNPDTIANMIKPLYKLSYNKWYFDEIYAATFIGGTIGISKLLSWFDIYVIDGAVNGMASLWRGISLVVGWFDNNVVDGLVNFTANFTGFWGGILRKLQTGRVQTYIVLSVIGLMILVYFFS
ncbi:MAG: NADH-quinone oxidoreductase subunit L [Chloroflexota bacterium]